MGNGREELRVALIAGTLGRGGAEKQLVYMARTLLDRGCQVRVHCVENGEHYCSALRELGIEPQWFGGRRRPWLRVSTLIGQLRRWHPHVVQATHSFTSIYAAIAGRALGAVSLGAVRDDPMDCVREIGRWAVWGFRAPDALVVNSQHAARELVKRWSIPPERVCWVPNSIDVAPFGPMAPRPRRDGLTVAFAGRMIRRKRLDVFLRAMASARRSDSRLEAVIAGDGPERERMMALARELDLPPEAVRFVGERDDVPALLKDADLFVLPSDSEGTPNVVLEAMAAGLPVIATPAGDAALLVRDRVSGFVVPAGNTGVIADRILQLARDPGLRLQMGRAGRADVERRFGLGMLASRLLEVYQATARRARRGRTLTAVAAVAPPAQALAAGA